MIKIFQGLFDSNDKQINKIQKYVDEINLLEKDISKLSDTKLKEKTEYFRKQLGVNLDTARKDFNTNSSEQLKKILDDEKVKLREILPEAFAVVREASKRVANHRHFDAQVMAGYVLFDNKVAELFTGEGKTLAANLPLYLYALTGRGAHLVTVNDYLAKRDAEWTGHILNILGMTTSDIYYFCIFCFI